MHARGFAYINIVFCVCLIEDLVAVCQFVSSRRLHWIQMK